MAEIGEQFESGGAQPLGPAPLVIKKKNMYETIELKDGSILIPSCLSDALDEIEEQMGTDIRQYLELYLEGDAPPALTSDEKMDVILETIEAQLALLEAELEEAKATPKRVQGCIEKIRTLIRRSQK